MYWKKVGQLYSPKSNHPKLLSHAANPLPIKLNGDIYRIFYNGRDNKNRSSVGYVDINILTKDIIYTHNGPIFEYGPEGSFYSHGVSLGNCYEVDERRYILFMGWQCPPNGHWRGDIGRLVLNEDLSLTLDDTKPFMGANETDPISLSYPWVLQDKEGLFRMWYGSTITWDTGNGEMLHVLKYATSVDGQNWIRHGESIPYEIGVAQAFSRPTVLVIDNLYHMWFSYRSGSGTPYRIGYASSEDGITWKNHINNSGINVSQSGWDSQMIEYPFVFEHSGEYYMLYNGDSHGISGFGLAVLESI